MTKMKLHLLQLSAYQLILATQLLAYRLPTTIIPSAYNVQLNLSAEAFTASTDEYQGSVAITLRATESNLHQIQLHAAHDFIAINSAVLDNNTITDISVDNSTDIVTFSNFSAPLSTTNNATLYIDFSSRLSTQDMYGFYKSSYISNGVTKYLATTQFQPVYARRAFPCFDEPNFKAVFEIHITMPVELNALSNMPGEVFETFDDNSTTTHFATSGRMPTYLVAFIVSDFSCTQGENIESTVPYRVCSSVETNSTRQLAMEFGVPLLRSLNAFTNYNYSNMGFPKIDQVAIPDFAAGAMENWGLVTYREQYLLWDPEESTNRDQQIIATIISHEFAHQWWGNLVTMIWWSETFLNEGFATYFEFFTTHEVFPEWELDKQWIVRVLQRVLETDSLESSQALQSPANNSAQVMEKFGQVSYLKGGSIFRMVEHILGKENFRSGLQSYLSTYAFKNTVPDDLWNILDQQLIGANRTRLPTNTSLVEVMQNWTMNPGYPIINVQHVGQTVIISQEGRFLLHANDTTGRWYIPLTYATNENPDFENTAPQDWILPLGYVEIPFLGSAQWIVLNNRVTGYYRVNYNNLWDAIITALQAGNFSGIPEVNRAAFVDDAFQLARATRINYNRTFAIIDFLRNDTSHHSWYPAISGFNFLLERVGQDSRLGKAISSHMLDLLSTIYSTVPWIRINQTEHAYSIKQIDILSVACRLGLSNCVNHALERFGEFRISGRRPTPNVRSIVYCNALRYGNSRQDWNLLWSAYNTTHLASEKVIILSALGCIQDEETLQYYLQLSLDENSGIRPQDAISVFTSVYSGSSMGIAVAFRFLRENYQVIEERYQSMNALRNMMTGLAGRFTTESEVNELRNFIEAGNIHADFGDAASWALTAAESNLQWLIRHSEELYQYYGIDPNATETESTTTPAITSITVPVSTTTTTESSTTTDSGAGTITGTFLLSISTVFALVR